MTSSNFLSSGSDFSGGHVINPINRCSDSAWSALLALSCSCFKLFGQARHIFVDEDHPLQGERMSKIFLKTFAVGVAMACSCWANVAGGGANTYLFFYYACLCYICCCLPPSPILQPFIPLVPVFHHSMLSSPIHFLHPPVATFIHMPDTHPPTCHMD